MEPEMSLKNTKNEILEAYQEACKKLEESKRTDRQVEKARTEKKEVVETALQNSVERVVNNLAELKLGIAKSLDELEGQLIGESKKLNGIRQAIEIENGNLLEIHEIRATADSLAALLYAQKEKRQQFETQIVQEKTSFEVDMADKLLQWKKEQEEFERQKKEREDQLKKDRQREQEEYAYSLKLERKRDEDGYAARSAALEKDLEEKRASFEKSSAEREVALASRENELAELRSRVEAFPKDMEKALRDAEKSITERLQFTNKFEKEMLDKEVSGEQKLSQQVITSLEGKIKEQDEQIRQLTQKANEAGVQVQSIAIKAIEGASLARRGFEREDEGGR